VSLLAFLIIGTALGAISWVIWKNSTTPSPALIEPQLVWNDPEPIMVGTPLSLTQLNATANVDAVRSYDPDFGTILPVGSHRLLVTFTPKDTAKYATASKTVTLVVNPKPPTKPQETPTTVIKTAPAYGNLHARTIALSNSILEDLTIRGFAGRQAFGAQTKITPDEMQMARRNFTFFYRFSEFPQIVELRDDLAKSNLRDEELDEIIKEQQMIESVNRQTPMAAPQVLISPGQVEEIARCLQVLAKQIPEQ
jgi:hypothetical protein